MLPSSSLEIKNWTSAGTALLKILELSMDLKISSKRSKFSLWTTLSINKTKSLPSKERIFFCPASST